MSKVKNAPEQNDVIVENNVNNENANVMNAENLTVEQETAQRVLRAKLPALSARNLNFEKRTGNVFTASIVKVFDESGQPVYENGEHKERLVRKVIEIETEDGDLLPAFMDIKEDLKAKRSAALVLSGDVLKEKLALKIAALEGELSDAKIELSEMDVTLEDAAAVVMSVVLPEKTERINVSAKLSEATNKLDKMRSMLLAAGLSEAEIDEQLNG